MRAKIRQLFCLLAIIIITLAIGAAAINVYMVWGTKGRILKKDQWANFKADGVVVLGCAVRPNKEASPMLNDRMQTAISFYNKSVLVCTFARSEKGIFTGFTGVCRTWSW